MRTIKQTKEIIETLTATMSNVEKLTAILDGEYQQSHIDAMGEKSEQFAKMADTLRQAAQVLSAMRHMENDYLDDLQNL